MVRIHEIKLRAGEPLSKLLMKVEKRLGLPKGSVYGIKIAKESVDAREKPVIYRVFSLDLDTDLPDSTVLLAAKNKNIKAGTVKEEKYEYVPVTRELKHRPVVCGFGPCGIFAALTLAQYGLRPIVLERGASMEERIEAVENFWNGGKFDPSANVQFGEGGAGTFSDGKLTTGTKDPAQKVVLDAFVEAGADPSILYKQRPHIGTDVIRRCVVSLRNKITELGGEVRFRSQLTGIESENGALSAVLVNGEERLETDTLILAVGHSARDSFEMLLSKGLKMEQKPFSMGVRIEHKQSMVDMAQYGRPAEEIGLGPADYKLSARTAEGRGVYTFCMCPGGYVVASESCEGQCVTNGMSNSDRGGENANSAVLVDVRPEDFGSDHPLAGVHFQEKYERLAFRSGGSDNHAPAQRLGDFMGTGVKAEDELTEPTFRPGVRFTDLAECLPDFVSRSLKEAIPELDSKLKGFASPGAVMTAIESRSSSPVRIKRSVSGEAETLDGPVISGIYPAGEGAGYAGGIMSSAVDGIRSAQKAVTAHF